MLTRGPSRLGAVRRSVFHEIKKNVSVFFKTVTCLLSPYQTTCAAHGRQKHSPERCTQNLFWPSRRKPLIGHQGAHRKCDRRWCYLHWYVVLLLAHVSETPIQNANTFALKEIIITNNGLDCIEVSDNGKGIPFEHYETVALRYTTSKLETMEDLSRIHSFGFRGEGLNSLCAVAKVSAVTRTSKDPTGYQLVFNEEGTYNAILILRL